MYPENLSSSLESFSQWKYLGGSWDTSIGLQEMSFFCLWGPELGVCPVTGELTRPCSQVLLLPKENLEKFAGETQSLHLCGFRGSFIHLASAFVAGNSPEAVGKECGLGEGRGCWLCVSHVLY